MTEQAGQQAAQLSHVMAELLTLQTQLTSCLSRRTVRADSLEVSCQISTLQRAIEALVPYTGPLAGEGEAVGADQTAGVSA